MSFTSYKWGVSRPYRSIWPILGFSSLRTDYARVVQVNDFFIRIVHKIFKRIRSFRNFINFSHILLKTYSVTFYDRPLFSLEIFFWVKHLKDLFLERFKKLKKKINRRFKKFNKRYKRFGRNRTLANKKLKKLKKLKTRSRRSNLKLYRKDLVNLKRSRKVSGLKYKRMLKSRRNFSYFSRSGLVKNFYIVKNKYNLLGFSRAGYILFIYKCRRFMRRRGRRVFSRVKSKKPLNSFFALGFRKRLSYKILKDIKILPKKLSKIRKKRKSNFKRYRYYRKQIHKRSRHLRISNIVRPKRLAKRLPIKGNRLGALPTLKYKLNVVNLVFFLRRVKRAIQRKRVIFFLDILNNSFKILKINTLFLARLINLASGTIYLYLNHFTKKVARRREVNPKSLVKTLIRDLKKNRKSLRITGAILKARGRFTRRDRAPKVRASFGSISVSNFNTRISYAQKDFIFRFGKASIKMIISHAR